MSALALEVLAHMEASADIRLVRDGDVVRILTRPGADVAEVTPRVRELKPILLEALLQREIMALAHGPTDTFDRARFDELFAEWKARYGVPWDESSTRLPSRAHSE